MERGTYSKEEEEEGLRAVNLFLVLGLGLFSLRSDQGRSLPPSESSAGGGPVFVQLSYVYVWAFKGGRLSEAIRTGANHRTGKKEKKVGSLCTVRAITRV